MIILPDRSLSRGKLLMPIPKWQWREPSVALARDQFNNKVVRTFFRLTARLADGHIVWRGQFDDRDDADAFLFALASGSLRYERDLWRLPTPEWHPGISTDLIYEFATVAFLTGTGASLTYNVPADWSNTNNIIRCVGGGGSGGARRQTDLASAANASGGGGGGYGEYTNLTLTAGGTATYGIVNGGGDAFRSTNGSTNGSAGGSAYFNGGSYAAASVGGTGGAAGLAGTGTLSAASGGTGKGTASANGGSGGAVTATSLVRRATGGGGAAGPNGNGGNGVDLGGTTSSGTDGGNGDNGSGGTAGLGGSGSGGNAGDGTEFQVSPSYGCGGGGGGRHGTSSTSAGDGGFYGGGGGGASVSTTGSATSGTGSDGLIVVEYTPDATSSLANNNLPMLGM
jgi:hypothetical protein